MAVKAGRNRRYLLHKEIFAVDALAIGFELSRMALGTEGRDVLSARLGPGIARPIDVMGPVAGLTVRCAHVP